MRSNKRMYIRCNGGHFFWGQESCPFDGWSCDAIGAALRAFEDLGDESLRTIENLSQRGVPEMLLRRVVIAEFGASESAFEALSPSRYLQNGKILEWHEIGLELY